MNEVTSCDTSNSVEEKSKIDAVKLNSKPSTSESSALERSKLASQSGGAPGGVVFAGGESKGEAELDVYTTWISAGDRVEVGDGRRHDGGAGRARLVRFPASDGRHPDCGTGRARVVRFLRRVRRPRRGSGGARVPSASSLLRSMGSTAVVVVVGAEKLVIANCGDSRAVLCCNGVAVPLSRDHKPDRPDERERVEAAGGNVINWDGFRVLGVLSISRSIGDYFLRPYVISEPEVTVWERKESDEFLVIATDGLWDVVTNELACKLVKRYLSGKIRRRFSEGTNASCAMEAASILTELAMARGSKDNISVIVVQLKKHHCHGSLKKPNRSSP
ncbi:unnamed protein product, partial [Vitis vinifera]|uniref:PPM-type phosphatase domain-containing protein n=1 Tax=Vitis vinifera TaxID=29760 RepID=D7TVG7_VITVI